MKKDLPAKLEIWINKLSPIDPEIARHLETRKWSKAIFALYMLANFGILTPLNELTGKRRLAIELYSLSKDIRNKRDKGLAFELLTRHLLMDKDYELAYRCFLQAKNFFLGDMAWIGVKELFNYFPDDVLKEVVDSSLKCNFEGG